VTIPSKLVVRLVGLRSLILHSLGCKGVRGRLLQTGLVLGNRRQSRGLLGCRSSLLLGSILRCLAGSWRQRGPGLRNR
jgi:hypothetical protein